MDGHERMPMDRHDHYYLIFAAAFVRGRLRESHQDASFFQKPLGDLTEKDLNALFLLGQKAGLRLHRYKRTGTLPRVRKVLGVIKGLHPDSLLDIGTGRGAFLWPLMDAFHGLPVTCIDRLDYRTADIHDVAQGGINHLQSIRMDAGYLGFKNKAFDGVTLLEVLEHIPDPQPVIREACRVAKRFVILTVPSKKDTNPEHLHLFNTQLLRGLFEATDAFKVKFDTVLNHLVLVATRA